MPPIRTPEERMARTLARMAPGSLGGTVPSAARPVHDVGTLERLQGSGSLIAGEVSALGADSTTTQPIPTGGPWTAISFENVAYDTGSFYAGGVVTIPVDGYYLIDASIAFQPTPGGAAGAIRGMRIKVGGMIWMTDQRLALNRAGGWDYLHGVVSLHDLAGNVVEVEAFQDSGAVVSVDGSTAVGNPQLRVILLAAD